MIYRQHSRMSKDEKQYWAAFFVCSLASLLPLWLVKYPPMTDLPAHAAQVFIIKNLHNPAFGFEGVYEVNFFTPYLFAYATALLFAQFFSVLVSLKLMLSIALFLWPLSLRTMLKEAKGNLWWSLLGFPLFYGHAFYWGLITFEFSVPLAFFVLALGMSHAKKYSPKKAAGLAGAGVVLFFSHVIVFLYTMMILGFYLFFCGNTWRDKARNLWPLLAPLPLVINWKYAVQGDYGAINWEVDPLGPLLRIYHFPGLLLEASVYHWVVAVVVLSMAFLIYADHKLRHYSQPLTWTFAFVLLLYLFFPEDYFISKRMMPFVAALFLINFVPHKKPGTMGVKKLLVTVLVVSWTAFLSARFWKYNLEAKQIDSIIEVMEPRKRVLGLMFQRFHKDAFAFPFVHFVNWYQAEKGGYVRHTFTSYRSPTLVRFKSPEEMAYHNHYSLLCWQPGKFDWYRETHFDYFIVRSPVDLAERLFPEKKKVKLVKQVGSWWLYART